MSNLALWKEVETTPPSETKRITGKPYQGTSPKPYWLVKRATEVFGPIGIGWGFDIVDEKLLDGALIEPGFNERIHMARVRVWYKWNGERGEVEHVGQTVFCGRRKGYQDKPGLPFTDEDAPKKSVTDALVKALSMIGFAGDIFIGRYDDSKYIDGLRDDEAASSPATTGNGKRTAPQQPDAPQQPQTLPADKSAELADILIEETVRIKSGADLQAWAARRKPDVDSLAPADRDRVRDAYAAKLNYFKGQSEPPHDPETGELTENAA